MQLKYLHQESQPLLPAIGDIRFVPSLETKDGKAPKCKIEVTKCVKILDHHVVYEILGKDIQEAIPYELVNHFGFLSIDDCVKWILNSSMQKIIDAHSNNSETMFSNSTEISEYYVKLKDLIMLSRQALKEADKAKNFYSKELEK